MKTAIIICGPTAVGKTAFAIQLAQALGTSIISADSRQCFKELNIGVAKPSAEELHAIHHYFINSHSITETVNAVVFEAYAIEAADKVFEDNDYVVVVGGTGLYINAFCYGFDPIPEIDPAIRSDLIDKFSTKGIQYIQDELKRNDPEFWLRAEQQNPQRLIRALEVKLSTGKSIHEFHQGARKERAFNVIKVGLDLPRSMLYERVNKRVDSMMEAGLLKEVGSLIDYKHLNALQTVGYKELFDYLANKTALNDAIATIKTNTRHYAKRQLTWFKKDQTVTWFEASNITTEMILDFI